MLAAKSLWQTEVLVSWGLKALYLPRVYRAVGFGYSHDVLSTTSCGQRVAWPTEILEAALKCNYYAVSLFDIVRNVQQCLARGYKPMYSVSSRVGEKGSGRRRVDKTRWTILILSKDTLAFENGALPIVSLHWRSDTSM